MSLSVIVPTYSEADTIAHFLAHLQRALGPVLGSEILVVDGGSPDGTVAEVESVGIRCLTSELGRAKQMNRGAATASGDFLLFLHCDTALPASLAAWWREVSEVQPQWGFFGLQLDSHRWPYRVIEAGINWRSARTQVATGDQALFVRSDVWRSVGGYQDIPLMEDVALCKRLRKSAEPMIWCDPVRTSSRRWQENGLVRTVLLMWWLRLAYWWGVKPEVLKRYYKTRVRAAARERRARRHHL